MTRCDVTSAARHLHPRSAVAFHSSVLLERGFAGCLKQMHDSAKQAEGRVAAPSKHGVHMTPRQQERVWAGSHDLRELERP